MAHIPRLHQPGPIAPGPVTLEGDQARRIGTVLRLREGDRFLMFGSDGQEWQVCVENVGRQRVHARVEDMIRQERPPAPYMELGIGIVRANRMDWAIEKCVEAGVDSIRPLTTAFTSRGSGDSAKRMERWQRVAVEAAEQSGRLFVPEILEPMSLDAWMHREHGRLLFGDREGQRWDKAREMVPSGGRVAFAIGPEGGFSQEELAQLRAAGGIGVWLAPNILRTETAAVVATALVRSMQE
jgi:16S rRNA (uracil1498-N3)-methyltransferase